MRILVVYYSLTGRTAAVAKAVADGRQADHEQIEEQRRPGSRRGYLAAAIDALFDREVPLKPMQRDLATYDLVAIGTPVWIGRPSAPVRSFLRTQGEGACVCNRPRVMASGSERPRLPISAQLNLWH